MRILPFTKTSTPLYRLLNFKVLSLCTVFSIWSEIMRNTLEKIKCSSYLLATLLVVVIYKRMLLRSVILILFFWHEDEGILRFSLIVSL